MGATRSSTFSKLRQIYWLWRERGIAYVLRRIRYRLMGEMRYVDWIAQYDALSTADMKAIRRRIGTLAARPRFAIVIVVELANSTAARLAVKSVREQLYPNWKLTIFLCDGAAGDWSEGDQRINVRTVATKAEIAVQSELQITEGDWILYLDPFVRLASHALYMVAEELSLHPDATVVYADDDEVDTKGDRCNPRFKPDWSPDLILSQDYIGETVFARRSAHVSVDGVRLGLEVAAVYDLLLRLTAGHSAESVRHIPMVLSHRDVSKTVSAEHRADAERRVVAAQLTRSGIDATVAITQRGRRIKRSLPQPPRASIVIPTRDRVDLLRGTLESVLGRTDYPYYEIIVVDNGSSDPRTLNYLTSLKSRPGVRVMRDPRPFNYSALNNFAVAQVDSPITVLLNNDVTVIAEDWLTELVSHAVRPEVGAVGAMLYYPDDTIQHAGVIVGVHGAASNLYGGLSRTAKGYCGRAQMTGNYSAVTAACLATRTALYREVGGLDELDLPIAFSDVDYCLKLRARGYLVTWTPYAELYHLESVSRGDDLDPENVRRFRAEALRFAERWSHVIAADPYYNPNLSLDETPFRLARTPRYRPPWR